MSLEYWWFWYKVLYENQGVIFQSIIHISADVMLDIPVYSFYSIWLTWFVSCILRYLRLGLIVIMSLVTDLPRIISMICWLQCTIHATHVGVSNRKYQSTYADYIQESFVHITAEIPDLRRALPLTDSIWGASALNRNWAWHSIALLLSELGMLYYLI